ncbi:ATP-binding protein [Peribacillus sp. NPDC096540]|uniref:sensor histidine kinase n=1 Tax=Peribacillus sp. NPDC096540 TaxID=3390612 RepID=UPI003D0330A6
MKLKKKYQLLLTLVIISVPLSLLIMNFIALGIYKIASATKNQNVPFHESFAYPTMYVLFFLSFLLLAFLFSRSIHSLLNKITLLNKTIKNLASNENIPEKIDIKSDDEIGELIHSVNLLIERTTYREIEMKQQEGLQREYLNKLRHDINTPLTAIRLQLFYLEGEHPTLALESLYQQIQYIADLTDEVHMESVDSLDTSYIMRSEVNINNLLKGMVRKWAYLYSINDIELSFRPLDEDLVWMSHDLWLQRLFDNVFQNTLKHSNADKLEVIIHQGVISIRDNGKGFDCREEHKGLGLKVIEDLAKVLNIKYTVHSNSAGTLFNFTIET